MKKLRRGTRYTSSVASAAGEAISASTSSRTSGVQRSSASRLKTQSPVQCAMAWLRKSPKPLNSICTTRAPSDCAISCVPSVLFESTSKISSAQRAVEMASRIFSASL